MELLDGDRLDAHRSKYANYILSLLKQKAQTLCPQHFKRRFGVQRNTFKQMVSTLQPLWRPIPKPGAIPKLGIEERVLVALEYWREYRTYFHIGSSWGVSKSSVCRIVHWVEDTLMRSGRFRLPGKKQLVRGFGKPTVVVVDAAETPIERPKRRQREFYSGQKKRHTLKCQLVLIASDWQNYLHLFREGATA